VVPEATDPATELGRVLGGTVHGLTRLSGGASRITSSFDLVGDDGSVRPLILQQERGVGPAPGDRTGVEAALLTAAADAGVPVPGVVAAGSAGGLDPGWLVVERLEGETIPRRLLRDDAWASARDVLTGQCATALAAIHRIPPGRIPGLPSRDPFRDPLPFLDGLGEVRPALELGVRWLELHRPDTERTVTVHGDFRMGNLLVGTDGLRAVLDWELAHAGDPAEDLGWLCAPAWRFGGSGAVGGVGDLDALLAGYEAAGGGHVDPDRVRWWQVYATVKWAVICVLQASVHLGGGSRSVELATIGRRVCESEWDLFGLLGVTPDDGPAPTTTPRPADVIPPFGRPTAAELVEAVREHLETTMARTEGDRARFDARVARNALAVVERELQLGPTLARAHTRRLTDLGFDDDASLASAIRSGAFDRDPTDVARALAASARDQLLVANPDYVTTDAG
jgi:aminoglycoside phosphotransferase (APT) family kinase protein